jgi:hypothetical protein
VRALVELRACERAHRQNASVDTRDMDAVFGAFTWARVVTVASVAMGNIVLTHRDNRRHGRHS